MDFTNFTDVTDFLDFTNFMDFADFIFFFFFYGFQEFHGFRTSVLKEFYKHEFHRNSMTTISRIKQLEFETQCAAKYRDGGRDASVIAIYFDNCKNCWNEAFVCKLSYAAGRAARLHTFDYT